MDIDRIQKINTLALDLVKKGLAETQEDAIAQAEQIFRVREDDVTFTRPPMQNNSLQVSGLSKRDSSSTNQKSTPGVNDKSVLHQDQIKEILEKNTQFLVSKIRDFTSKIEQVQSELAQVKQELAKKNSMTPPSTISNMDVVNNKIPGATSEVKEGVQQPTKTPSPSPQTKPQEDHPRSGIFGDTDVSIEKFFYAGNK